MDFTNQEYSSYIEKKSPDSKLWKNVLCAKDGIEHGSIFADLILPFYGCNYKNRR